MVIFFDIDIFILNHKIYMDEFLKKLLMIIIQLFDNSHHLFSIEYLYPSFMPFSMKPVS